MAPQDSSMISLEKNRQDEADVVKMAELSRMIENMRKQLVELVEEKGFANREVVELSQHLDEYIVLFQNKMNTQLK